MRAIGRSWKAIAAALVLGLVPAVASGDAQGAPYTIPVVLPMSGTTAFAGQQMAASLHAVEKLVNGEGGIKGRPVRFDIRDDQSSPQTAVQVTQQLMTAKPPVILGSAIVAQCLAMEPLTRGKTVQYCISPAVHPRYGDDLFSAGFSTRDNTLALLRYLGARKLVRVATLTSIDATGQDADRQIAEAAEVNAKSGVRIVDAEHFNPTDPSVSAQMQRIKAARPDAIVVWTTGPAFGTALRAYADAGMHATLATTIGNLSYQMMHQFAAYVPDDLLFPAAQFAVGPPPAGAPGHTEIQRYVDALHDAGLHDDDGTCGPWDPAMLVIDAVRHIGVGATAAQIRDYILSQRHWIGILGTYDFGPGSADQRGLFARDVVIVRWDKAHDGWVAVSKPGGLP